MSRCSPTRSETEPTVLDWEESSSLKGMLLLCLLQHHTKTWQRNGFLQWKKLTQRKSIADFGLESQPQLDRSTEMQEVLDAERFIKK